MKAFTLSLTALLLTSACSTRSAEPTPTTTSSQSGGAILGVWCQTRPANDGTLRTVLPDLIKALGGAADAIGGVDAVVFGGPGGVWDAPARPFDWGLPPAATFNPKTLKIPPEKKLFRAAYDKAVNEARARFEADANRARQERPAKIDQALLDLERFVLQSSTGQGACVPYRDLAEHMRSRNLAYNLVLTSGARGCEEVVQPVAVPGEIIVLMIPAPSSSAVPEHVRFEPLEARVATAFPTAHIVRPYSLSVIAQLLGAPGNAQQTVTASVPAPARAPVRKAAFVGRQEPVLSIDPAPTTAPHVHLPESLKRVLERVQRENVRASWGPEQGQCYTCKDLQDDLAALKPTVVATALRQNREFIAAALALKELPEEERTILTNGCRVSLHKTWTELGTIGPEGQTDCGKQMELAIVNKCIDTLLDLVDKSSGELEKALASAR